VSGEEAIVDRSRLQEGMLVFGSHGEKLGRIARCDQETFVIEKGTLFPKEYVARYEDVAEILEGDVRPRAARRLSACSSTALARDRSGRLAPRARAAAWRPSRRPRWSRSRTNFPLGAR
jgi:hypothetical protein